MTEPTDKETCLNIADQCTATASNDITASILVDGGSGTLRELLNDAADAIRAGWAAPQPAQAQAGAVPLTDEQIDDYIRHADAGGRWGEAFAQGVRWAIRHYECAHGIGIKNGGRHA